jgi:hypothetical protein
LRGSGFFSAADPKNLSASGGRPVKLKKKLHIRQIKSLDIFPKRSILKFIRQQFSIPVIFQHNCNLSGMGMKTGLPKVLKVKPPGIFGSLPEAFSFRG